EYIKELIKLYRNHIPDIKLLDDAKEVLDYLFENNYRLGMITDGYKETQRNKLKVLNIEKYFEHIIVTDELGREFWKPSEVPYKLIKEKFNCNYEDMIYIGDNLEKDFISANKLGILTIQICRKSGVYTKVLKNLKSLYQPQIKIKTLNEIKKIKNGRRKLK
ncbi:MAG: HAD family hydrolase, partial [Fusobacteriaceae bacterium]